MDDFRAKEILEYTQQLDNIKGTASSKAIDIAINALNNQIYGGWISCNEKLPNDAELYLGIDILGMYALVHMKNGKLVNSFGNGDFVAWQPLPKPYNPTAN